MVQLPVFFSDMEGRKVWKFLSILSPAQQQQWLRYLAFQYGAKQQYLQALAAYLVQSFPTPPESEACWQELYPDTSYDDGRIRKLAGDLTSTLEQFLSLQSQIDNPLDQKIHLLRGMVAQSDKDLFEQTWKKVCKDVYKLADSAAEIAKYRYELELLNREYRVRHRMKDGAFWIPPQEEWWGQESSLQRIAYLNSIWNLYQKLELIVHADITAINDQKKIEIPQRQEYLDLAQNDPLFNRLPLVKMYLRILRLPSGDEVITRNLIRYLFIHHQSIPKSEKNVLFSSLLNSLIGALNKFASPQTLPNLLDLYAWGIKNSFLKQQGILLPSHYKNFIKLCIRAGEIDRAKEFIQDERLSLPKDQREELPLLNQIYVAFAEKDFAESIRLINRTQFSKVMDEIDARSILLQAHYEQNSWDEEWLEHQINGLIRYTRNRKDLDPTRKELGLKQFRLTKQLFIAQTKEDYLKLQDSLQQLPATGIISWIREKVKTQLSG